ncbi:hypothetical protein KJ742_07570 [Patescibacteria group bacterium]|nr:hypothetical protein [Patescibacteria group bacterium]MBU1683770.1 hypothetical protein [Patescibacteria group bacterium]MBU1934753.1 hypothetical protein [Patescibacteria group bacterium]
MPAEQLPFSPDKLQFNSNDVEAAFEAGRIDDSDRKFLENVIFDIDIRDNREVVQDVIEYRWRVGNGQQPGQERFIRMQKLGLKNHPLTGLDISGYTLPEVDLAHYARHNLDPDVRYDEIVIGGDLNMADTTIEDDVKLMGTNIQGDLIQSRAIIGDEIRQWEMAVGGDLDQSGIKVRGDVCQWDTKVGGSVDQSGIESDGDLRQSNMEVGGDLDQSGMKVGGDVDQSYMKVGGDVDQLGMTQKNQSQAEAFVPTSDDDLDEDEPPSTDEYRPVKSPVEDPVDPPIPPPPPMPQAGEQVGEQVSGDSPIPPPPPPIGEQMKKEDAGRKAAEPGQSPAPSESITETPEYRIAMREEHVAAGDTAHFDVVVAGTKLFVGDGAEVTIDLIGEGAEIYIEGKSCNLDIHNAPDECKAKSIIIHIPVNEPNCKISAGNHADSKIDYRAIETD